MRFLSKCKLNSSIKLSEILYKYGGIYIDADSICIEPIDNLLNKYKAFATYENELTRKGLVANGNMGFLKEHKWL